MVTADRTAVEVDVGVVMEELPRQPRGRGKNNSSLPRASRVCERKQLTLMALRGKRKRFNIILIYCARRVIIHFTLWENIYHSGLFIPQRKEVHERLNKFD